MIRREEIGDDRDGRAAWPTVDEGDEDHLIAVERVAVPTAMLGHECAVRELGRQRLPIAEGDAKRRDVGAEAVIRPDRLGDHRGVLRMHAHIDVLAPVAVRPAVEGALLDRGQVVGDQVRADLVPLIDDGEQLSRAGLDRQVRWVARSAGVNPLGAGQPVDFVDGRASLLDGHPVLGDVAVRADAHVELRSIGADHHRLGPVVVDRACG